MQCYSKRTFCAPDGHIPIRTFTSDYGLPSYGKPGKARAWLQLDMVISNRQEVTGPQGDAVCRTESPPMGPSPLSYPYYCIYQGSFVAKGCILPHAFAGSQSAHSIRNWSLCSTYMPGSPHMPGSNPWSVLSVTSHERQAF